MLKYFLLNRSTRKTFFIIFISLTFFGCDQATPKVAVPKPAVSIYQVKNQALGSYREFVARTQASKEANLVARVEGELIERHFKEGSTVKKDQILLTIEPAAFEANLVAAEADLASKISGQQIAEKNLTRAKDLIGDGYISRLDFDKLTTNDSQAKSAVKAAQANVQQAELDLSYTNITAPFTGQIGKVNYNVGNIIGPNSNVLATVILTDPMYVSFQIEESTYISYMQKHHHSRQPDKLAVNLFLRLPNNSDYPEQGKLDFADTKITQGMGTVELRAVFPNPEGIILPGLFVTLTLESKNKTTMALVPQMAVQSNQQGEFVLVVDKDNT
ncbi:MAG: efflux RND transporter periplasmic adaptor subunit, partial [Colwellia sp.]